MRIPGFTGFTGGETRHSEAAIPRGISDRKPDSLDDRKSIPMPFDEAVGVEAMLGGCEATGVSAPSPVPFESPLMVDVEEDRPKEFVKGARCVSLSSIGT